MCGCTGSCYGRCPWCGRAWWQPWSAPPVWCAPAPVVVQPPVVVMPSPRPFLGAADIHRAVNAGKSVIG